MKVLDWGCETCKPEKRGSNEESFILTLLVCQSFPKVYLRNIIIRRNMTLGKLTDVRSQRTSGVSFKPSRFANNPHKSPGHLKVRKSLVVRRAKEVPKRHLAFLK